MKIKRIITLTVLALAFSNTLFSQVGIGTITPHASAELDVTSTSKGFLLPRMTTTDRGLISSPAKGLMIFNTTTSTIEVNVGTPVSPNWQATSGGSLPAGTSGQTLRHNGTTWVANSTIFNNGTNVGIGTASPSEKLDIESSDATKTAIDMNNTDTGDPKINLQLNGTTTFSMGIDNSDADKFKIGTSALETNTRLTIDASGNCGIGNTAPSKALDVYGAANIWSGARFYGSSSFMPAGSLTIGDVNQNFGGGTDEVTYLSGFMMECSNNTEIAIHDYGTRIASVVYYEGGATNRLTFGREMGAAWGAIGTIALNGNVGIGTNSPSQKLHVVGNICATGTIAQCSDLRYKKDIFKIDNALSLISKFNGYTYNFKVKEFPDHKFDSTAQVGFIAQELQEVLPQVVQENESGYLSVDYAKVTPLLLMAIKEQQAEIETLKAQASNSTQKLADLENKMNAMLLLLNKKEEVTVKQ